MNRSSTVSGDTLPTTSRQFYGDANQDPVIFEANTPMLSSPDKIHAVGMLRIPPLA